MNLDESILREAVPLNSIASEDGGGEALYTGSREVAVLDSFVYQAPRWCDQCAREETFIEVYSIPSIGRRVGYCFGCGAEKAIPVTRTNSEAA